MMGHTLMEAEKMLSVGEAAKLLRVSPMTVRQWFDSGALHGYKHHTGHRRISPESVREYRRVNGIGSEGDEHLTESE